MTLDKLQMQIRPRKSVAKKRWTVRYEPPFSAQREIPNIVTRPVIEKIASAITVNDESKWLKSKCEKQANNVNISIEMNWVD